MALTPEEIDRQMTLSEEAFTRREYGTSVTILNDIITHNPNYAPAHSRLGAIFMQSTNPQAALPYLNKAIEIVPNDPNNWISLGYYHKRVEDWHSALASFKRSIELIGENIQLYKELLDIYENLNDYNSILPIVKRLLQIDPNDIDMFQKYANALYEIGKKEDALQRYELLIRDHGEKLSEITISRWLELNNDIGGCHIDIRERVRELYISYPNNPMFGYLYALSAIAKLDITLARKLLDEVYELASDNIIMLCKISYAYQLVGMKKEAKHYLDIALEIDANDKDTIFAIARDHKFVYGDEIFQKLNAIEADIYKLDIKQKSTLHNVLGKAYDDVGELETAFAHYEIGGKLHAEGRQHTDYINLQKFATIIKKRFTKEFFDNIKIEGSQSKKPIFIVGMPRSGTSLLEQVLSGFDDIYGAGELKYIDKIVKDMDINGRQLFQNSNLSCFTDKSDVTYYDRGEQYIKMIERLAPPYSRHIIDKMPFNFSFVGLIYLILPNATILHTRRHPMEICLSAYRLKFGGGMYWSDDLHTIGKYYRIYDEIMRHWHEVLPSGKILDVRYEDTISDLEGQSRNIAKYIGVEWSKKALEFHKSIKPVRTASISQVRQPIYTTSTNRWREYEPYLKPLLDDISDLVEEYERELADRPQLLQEI